MSEMDDLARMAPLVQSPPETISSECWKIAFDATPVAISCASISDQTILYSNRAFQELFGYESGRFRTIAEWVETTYPYAEDRALAWERWGAFFTAPTACEYSIEPMEIRVLCGGGTIKTVLHRGVLLPEAGLGLATFIDLTDCSGTISRTVSSERRAQETEAVYRMLTPAGYAEDRKDAALSPWEALVGERHRQREALRLSEELLDRTGRLAGVGGWDVDLITGVVTWTAETHRLHAVPLDYKPTLESGINFYAPEARAMIAAVVQQASETGEGWDVEAPLIRADGQRIWVRVLGSVQFSGGKAVRLIGAFQDITARHAEQKALRLANERLVLATASGHIATWDWDITNNIAFWDERMYRMYGLDPATDEGCYALWARHVHPEDLEEAERVLTAAIKTGQPYEGQFRIVWPDGTVRHLRAMGQGMLDEAGMPTRMVGVNWDVTEQLRLAAEAANALKKEIRMKDDFLSHVSHELRSPLACIYSFAGILADGLAGEMTQPQSEYIEIILRNSRQLRSMIEDLLQVTQSNTGKLTIQLEETSVAEAVADAINIHRSAANLKDIWIEALCAEELPKVYADVTRLRQILIILLDNAVKFSGANGVIEVRATVSATCATHVELAVSDGGPGVEAAQVARIFEHLYQAESTSREGRTGLGLGLYIARDLVHRQGGTIWVESQPGHGSTFRFTVPVFTTVGPTAPWGVERRRTMEPTGNQGNQP